MSSQGPLSAGTGADDAGFGTNAWTNPGNIVSSNNTYATAALNAPSHYLKATNFGFSIPSGATIDGITVEWERRCDPPDTAADTRVRIVKGGTVGSTDKSAAGDWPTSDTVKSYGGASDLWGETWTDSDINASTFGAVLAAVFGSGGPGSGGQTANVDHCRITVNYTAVAFDPGSGFPWEQASEPLKKSQTKVVSYGNTSGVS